jgi:hypothetical protein
MTAPEDPLVPVEVELLDVLVVPELLVVPVVPELLVVAVVPEPLVEPEEDVALVSANWTASPDVEQPPVELIMTLAVPLKLYVPNSFHRPPAAC